MIAIHKIESLFFEADNIILKIDGNTLKIPLKKNHSLSYNNPINMKVKNSSSIFSYLLETKIK